MQWETTPNLPSLKNLSVAASAPFTVVLMPDDAACNVLIVTRAIVRTANTSPSPCLARTESLQLRRSSSLAAVWTGTIRDPLPSRALDAGSYRREGSAAMGTDRLGAISFPKTPPEGRRSLQASFVGKLWCEHSYRG